MFADDTSVFIKGDHLSKLVDELEKLYAWLYMNSWPLMLQTLDIIVFHIARIKGNNICSNVNVLMQNDPIDYVDNTKFIGAIINS